MKRNCAGVFMLLAATTIGCGEDITMPSTGTIYGTLAHPDGAPAAGIEILVEGTNLTAVSDVRGGFTINGVLAVDPSGIGRFYIVRGRGERDGVPVGFLVDHFKVKGSQSYSLGTVPVMPTGGIIGQVVLEAEQDHSGVVISLDGTSLSAVSRADGSFAIPRVPAHEGYHVLCSRTGYQDATIDTMPGTGGPISVQPGGTTAIPPTVLRVEPDQS